MQYFTLHKYMWAVAGSFVLPVPQYVSILLHGSGGRNHTALFFGLNVRMYVTT